MIGEPLSSGMPATHTLSLTPTVRPASGPLAAPGIEHTHDQPLDGFSAPTGRWPTSTRGYFTGRCSSGSSSRRVSAGGARPAPPPKKAGAPPGGGRGDGAGGPPGCWGGGGGVGGGPPPP